MLNIPSHKGNANQNHIGNSTSLLLKWLSSRKPKPKNVNEDTGKREPWWIVGGSVN
jgi:hypothetical protein